MGGAWGTQGQSTNPGLSPSCSPGRPWEPKWLQEPSQGPPRPPQGSMCDDLGSIWEEAFGVLLICFGSVFHFLQLPLEEARSRNNEQRKKRTLSMFPSFLRSLVQPVRSNYGSLYSANWLARSLKDAKNLYWARWREGRRLVEKAMRPGAGGKGESNR